MAKRTLRPVPDAPDASSLVAWADRTVYALELAGRDLGAIRPGDEDAAIDFWRHMCHELANDLGQEVDGYREQLGPAKEA